MQLFSKKTSLFFLATFCLFQLTWLTFDVQSFDILPSEIQKTLLQKNIPSDAYGFSVLLLNPSDQENQSNGFGWNANKSMNPASTMKILTTFSALDQLGSNYRFKTNLYLNGKIDNGIMSGQLYIKGFGDPKLVPESLESLMHQLMSLGVNTIDADIYLDTSAYKASVKNSAPNDGEAMRSYNVSPDPLLFSFQTITFSLSSSKNSIEISYTPNLSNFKVNNHLILGGNCADWRKNIHINILKDTEGNWAANFNGKFPAQCGNVLWNVVAIPNDELFKMGFIAAWEEAGGKWLKVPRFQSGVVPSTAPLVIEFSGTLLTDAIMDTNKYSNNVMARQIFLTPTLEIKHSSVTIDDAILLTKKWLQIHQLNIPELVLQNGSGLSDIERISPKHMTDLLKYAAFSIHNDLFVKTLPIAGVDGTMRHRLMHLFKSFFAHIPHENASKITMRLPEQLHETGAYLKTGSLSQVRAIAGYVVSKSGKVYAVSSIINHPNAALGGSAVNDALVVWLSEDGPSRLESTTDRTH